MDLFEGNGNDADRVEHGCHSQFRVPRGGAGDLISPSSMVPRAT